MFEDAKSWPFVEARSLLKHIQVKGKKPGDIVTFETGYGPSGAPHIGTFAEVVRTLWVMKAFDAITGNAYQTRLIMFSDDFDGLRQVPDGMPEWMHAYLDMPLTSVPNPYGNHGDDMEGMSFGEANNYRLCSFVNTILRSYDGSQVGASHGCNRISFLSSSSSYFVGLFDHLLIRVWEKYDDILNVILPTLTDRKLTYSPFIPRDETGRYIYDKIASKGSQAGLMRYHAIEDGRASEEVYFEHMVTGGRAKLQWKVDWAMRWVKFDVDYEMSGKDLIDSVKVSSKICKILGGTPPLNMTYELFLDINGAKISKSKGNGFSMEDWLTYGTPYSLQMFLFQNPKAAKPLHIDLVPKFEDEYIKARQNEYGPNDALWFQKEGAYNTQIPDVSFSLLLNLAIVSQSDSAESLVAYLAQQRDIDTADRHLLERLAERVLQYGRIKGLFDRQGRKPTENEALAFRDLADRFSRMLLMPSVSEDAYQFQVYEVGKAHGFTPLRDWFKALYECFFGSSDGPRFGTFVAANGLENTIRLLRSYEVADS